MINQRRGPGEPTRSRKAGTNPQDQSQFLQSSTEHCVMAKSKPTLVHLQK